MFVKAVKGKPVVEKVILELTPEEAAVLHGILAVISPKHVLTQYNLKSRSLRGVDLPPMDLGKVGQFLWDIYVKTAEALTE